MIKHEPQRSLSQFFLGYHTTQHTIDQIALHDMHNQIEPQQKEPMGYNDPDSQYHHKRHVVYYLLLLWPVIFGGSTGSYPIVYYITFLEHKFTLWEITHLGKVPRMTIWKLESSSWTVMDTHTNTNWILVQWTLLTIPEDTNYEYIDTDCVCIIIITSTRVLRM